MGLEYKVKVTHILICEYDARPAYSHGGYKDIVSYILGDKRQSSRIIPGDSRHALLILAIRS